MQPDGRGFRVHHLIVVFFQVNYAVGAECAHRDSGFGIQRNQPVANGDVENSLVLAVGPVRHAMAGKLPRSVFGAHAFVLAVHPDQLARRGVQADDRAARSSRDIELPFHHQRRAFILIFRPRAKDVRLDAPCNFQPVKVGSVDLIERRVSRVPEVSPVGAPLAILRAGLRVGCGNNPRHTKNQNDREKRTETSGHCFFSPCGTANDDQPGNFSF